MATSSNASPRAARPRVETHPPFELSYGPETVELARRAGLILDPWQCDSLTCMLAVRPDGKWTCFEFAEIVSRQNGKGSILEARALGGLFLFDEELVMWSAHEYKTAMEGYRRVLVLLGRLGQRLTDTLYDVDGILVKANNTNGEEGLERLDTGQRLKFIARSKGSGRGFTGDCNIIDEAFAYTRLQQAALMPTMSARPNPQIIYTSSPPLTGDTGEVLYALRERGDPTAHRRADAAPWAQDDALGWRDWGLPGDLDNLDGVDLDDRTLWYATNPALGGRLTVEYTGRERRSMSPADFARERLGIWPRQVKVGEGVIPTELWRDLAAVPERPSDVAFALVVNHKRSHTAIAAVGPRADGRLQASIVAYQPGTHWVVDRAVDLKARWNPVGFACQDKGPSGTLIMRLEEAGIARPEDRDEPRRGDLAVPWSNDVAVAYGLTIDRLRERQLVHVDDAPLNLAVAGAQTRPLGGGTTWDYQADADSAPLQAMSLALWLYVTWVDKVTVDRDEIGIF